MPDRIGGPTLVLDPVVEAGAPEPAQPEPEEDPSRCQPGMLADVLSCQMPKQANEGAKILFVELKALEEAEILSSLLEEPFTVKTRDLADEKKLAYAGNPGNYCGPSALVTALSAQGTVVSFEAIANRVNWPSGFLGWKEGIFTAPQALADVASHLGHHAVVTNGGTVEQLAQQVDKGRVPLVLNQGGKEWSSLHFIAITGYVRRDGQLTYLMVVSNGQRLRVPVALFEKLWDQVSLPGVRRLWIELGPRGSARATDHLPKWDGALHTNVVGAGLSEAFVGATHVKPQAVAGGLVKTVGGGTGAGLDYVGLGLRESGIPVVGHVVQGAGKLVTFTGGVAGGVVSNSTLKVDLSGNGKWGTQIQYDAVTSHQGPHQLYAGPTLRYQQGSGLHVGGEAGTRLSLDKKDNLYLQPYVGATHRGDMELGMGLNFRQWNNLTLSASVAKTREEGITPRLGVAVKY